MHDAFIVCSIERFRNLLSNGDCFGDWNRAARQMVGQRQSFDQFENDRTHVADLFEAIDCSDVRMREGRQKSRLAAEPGHAIGVCREFGRKYFQRYIATEPAVVRAIHHAHATGAEMRADFVGADACAWSKHW